MNENTLANYFKPILYRFHDREAMVFKTGFRSIRISYLDLYDHAYRMANWFQHNGLGKGDAVLLWAPNGPEWVAGLLACAITGVIAIPLDIRVQPEFVEYIAGETGAKAGIKSRFQNAPMEFQWWDIEDLPRQIKEAPPIFKEPEIHEDDILEIVYTSGTTAEPKGVILTNKNIVSNIRSVGKVLTFNKKWRFLSILPLSHMFEQTVGLFIPLFYGCSITYLRSKKSSIIMQGMQEESITSIITVPLMLQTLRDRILREVTAHGKESLFNTMLGLARRLPRAARRILFRSLHKKFGGCLEFFSVGGAPLDPETERFWNGVGVKVVQGYGLTETAPIVTCNTIADPRQCTVGRVLPDQHLKLSGEGEILVKGDNVTPGYYQRPDLTEKYFDDSWYRTGDVGELDSEGYLRIKGRTKNMILTASGMNVYPEDIEEALNHHPAVKDSCVLGVEREGKTVIQAVVLLEDKGADVKSIMENTNSRLADHQKIQAFSVWEKADFPRTPTLKIQRRFVLEELQRESDGEETHDSVTESPFYTIIRSVAGIKESDMVPEAALGLDLQIDSLLRVELVGIIEEEMGVEIDESLVTDKTTIAELETLVTSQKKAPAHKVKRWPLTLWARFLRRLMQYGFVLPLTRFYFPLRVMGREKFDGLHKPFLLIANHVSHLDAVVLTLALPWHVRRRLAVAAAADVFEYWDASKASLWERLARRTATILAVLGLNIFPFQRYAGIKKSLEYAGKLMDKGWSVMIFPEGRLSHDGTVQDFKAGAGLLVKEMSVPVVPAKILGAYEIMDYRYTWPHTKGTVTVRFGDPITFSADDSYEDITRRLEYEVKFL